MVEAGSKVLTEAAAAATTITTSVTSVFTVSSDSVSTVSETVDVVTVVESKSTEPASASVSQEVVPPTVTREVERPPVEHTANDTTPHVPPVSELAECDMTGACY